MIKQAVRLLDALKNIYAQETVETSGEQDTNFCLIFPEVRT